MPREKRLSEAALIEKKNQKPETSTPAPHAYNPIKELTMVKREGNVGGSALKM